MIASLWGCSEDGALSKPTAHLRGNVTIDGRPVPSDAEGTIVFRPAGGGGQAQPASATIVDSKYDAPNVPQGKVKAYFNIGRLTGRMITEAAGGSPFAEMEQLAPAEAETGISIDVTGDAERDFNL
jgi:hypothetical protein